MAHGNLADMASCAIHKRFSSFSQRYACALASATIICKENGVHFPVWKGPPIAQHVNPAVQQQCRHQGLKDHCLGSSGPGQLRLY